MRTFKPAMVHSLRLAYGGVHDLPDGSPEFNKVVDRVGHMTTAQRDQIEAANIRWLSPICRAIRLNKMDQPLEHSGGLIRDQGRGYL
jgi:hypothetical protein